MGGRRNRHRGRCATASSSGGLPVPEARLQDAADEAWTQSERTAMRRNLLSTIHRYYLDAISRLPPASLRSTLARGLLLGGHCFGPLHPLHNIILNSLWYAAAFPLRRPHGILHDDGDADAAALRALLSTDGIARICHRSLDGLLASLRHHCPDLSTGDALCQLLSTGADLAAAVALAGGTAKSAALRRMASRHGLAAFHLAACTARHPDPTAFAQFASSVLPALNAQHNIVQFLLINHVLSTWHTDHLSNMLSPALPHEPPQAPLMLSAKVLDRIASYKKQFKETGKQVLSVVNAALQEYTQRSGEQLMLHSVCGVNLLKEEGLTNCYHINFLAYPTEGAPLLFFTEAVILASNDTDIRLCVPVDPVIDIGCCFACESNKKKVVHPIYDEYLGGREFQVDEVDYGSNFPSPMDVDYIFFDAVRDRAFANYLNDNKLTV
ncbi:hypothetical protein ACP4OV_022501 [Aristida adscensionis]